MKKLIGFCLVAVLMGVASARASDTGKAAATAAEPPELEQLLKNYTHDLVEAQQPIHKRHEDALNQLKNRYTSLGNFKAAVAVDAELKKTAAPAGAAAEPPELEPLRKNYARDLVQAQLPVHKRYKDALNQLKTRYTGLGNLEAAVAVDGALKKFDEVARQSGADASVVARLLGTKWQWYEGQSIDFQAGGKGVYHGKRDLPFKWQVTAEGKILYEQGAKFTLELEGDHIKIINPNGQSWTGRYLGKLK